MPRQKRMYSETGIYHIIIRGNDKQNIFNDIQDRIFFLNRMQKYATELNIHIYAYCLMNNHVHLLIGNANYLMSKFMLKLNTSYSRSFNLKYERTGHLFQGRFLSKPVENNNICMKVIRYILYNPQKAGLGQYNEYLWNSFHCIISDNSINKNHFFKTHIDTKFVLNLFENIEKFKEYMCINPKEIFMEYEGRKKISDSNCILFIKKTFNISNIYQLNRMPVDTIKANIAILKRLGISQNQLSRITGISRKIIKAA